MALLATAQLANLLLHARESITKVTIPALTFIRAQGVLAVSVTVTLVLTLFTFVHVVTSLTVSLETAVTGTVSSGIACRIGATGYPFTFITRRTGFTIAFVFRVTNTFPRVICSVGTLGVFTTLYSRTRAIRLTSDSIALKSRITNTPPASYILNALSVKVTLARAL